MGSWRWSPKRQRKQASVGSIGGAPKAKSLEIPVTNTPQWSPRSAQKQIDSTRSRIHAQKVRDRAIQATGRIIAQRHAYCQWKNRQSQQVNQMKVAHLSRQAYKAHIECARSIRRQQVSSRMEYKKKLREDQQKTLQASRQYTSVARSLSDSNLRTPVDCRLDYGKLKHRYLQKLQEQVESELAERQQQNLVGASAKRLGFCSNKFMGEVQNIENRQQQDVKQQERMRQEANQMQVRRVALEDQQQQQLAQLQSWREKKVMLEAAQLEEEVQKVEHRYRGLSAALTAVNENCAVQGCYRVNQYKPQSFDRELAGSLKQVQSQLYGSQPKKILQTVSRYTQLPEMSQENWDISASTTSEFSDLLKFREKQEAAIYHEELQLILGRTRSKQDETEKRRQHTSEDGAILAGRLGHQLFMLPSDTRQRQAQG